MSRGLNINASIRHRLLTYIEDRNYFVAADRAILRAQNNAWDDYKKSDYTDKVIDNLLSQPVKKKLVMGAAFRFLRQQAGKLQSDLADSNTSEDAVSNMELMGKGSPTTFLSICRNLPIEAKYWKKLLPLTGFIAEDMSIIESELECPLKSSTDKEARALEVLDRLLEKPGKMKEKVGLAFRYWRFQEGKTQKDYTDRDLASVTINSVENGSISTEGFMCCWEGLGMTSPYRKRILEYIDTATLKNSDSLDRIIWHAHHEVMDKKTQHVPDAMLKEILSSNQNERMVLAAAMRYLRQQRHIDSAEIDAFYNRGLAYQFEHLKNQSSEAIVLIGQYLKLTDSERGILLGFLKERNHFNPREQATLAAEFDAWESFGKKEYMQQVVANIVAAPLVPKQRLGVAIQYVREQQGKTLKQFTHVDVNHSEAHHFEIGQAQTEPFYKRYCVGLGLAEETYEQFPQGGEQAKIIRGLLDDLIREHGLCNTKHGEKQPAAKETPAKEVEAKNIIHTFPARGPKRA